MAAVGLAVTSIEKQISLLSNIAESSPNNERFRNLLEQKKFEMINVLDRQNQIAMEIIDLTPATSLYTNCSAPFTTLDSATTARNIISQRTMSNHLLACGEFDIHFNTPLGGSGSSILPFSTEQSMQVKRYLKEGDNADMFLCYSHSERTHMIRSKFPEMLM